MDLLKAPKLPVVSSLPSASSDRAGELVYYNGVVYLCDGTKWTPLTKEFPLGSILITVDNINPATWLGYGMWNQFAQGRCLVGQDSTQTEFATPLQTGGAKTHTLTVNEIPAHSHTYTRYKQLYNAQSGTGLVQVWSSTQITMNTGNTGGGQPHNNLQPYIVVYFWRRIA